jgi:hypothetical protein
VPRGGKRAGAGKPKGYQHKPTLEKLAAREFVRQMVTQSLTPMIQAQIANAMGIGHVYTRDKGGKFTRIEDQAHIDRLLTEGTEDEDYWIFAKDPSTQAFTDLLNRALDKPKEQEQEIRVTGMDDLLARLVAARART